MDMNSPLDRPVAKSQDTKPSSMMHRCAGPNCGLLKGQNNRWWVMWTSYGEWGAPTLFLAPWSDELAEREGTMPVCGERCAQKLQSQFMGNVIENKTRRSKL